jgi:hypothetical protein
VFKYVSMDDTKPNTLTEKDIVVVAQRKDPADDPVHADWEFRDWYNGPDTLTDVQRRWLHHDAFSSPPQRRARARPQDGCTVSLRPAMPLVLSGQS